MTGSIGAPRTRDSAGPDGRIVKDDASVTLADAYLDVAGHDEEGRQVLWHWRGEFYVWADVVYRRQEPEVFRSGLLKFLRSLRVQPKRTGPRGGGAPRTYQPEPRNVRAVMETLAGECQAPVVRMPAWLDNERRPAASDVVAFLNGLLDFGRIDTQPLIPPTPAWFSDMVLPYRLDEQAKCGGWITFLDTVLPGNEKGKRMLQEWFGYCLTSDTRHQKLMLMIGPPRCGKGTICRMLQRMVGEGNYANPSFAGLGTRFGLEPLLGKRVAIVPDAHLGRDSDSVQVLDKLLQISGEDNVTVEPKGKTAHASVKLGVRFTIACNEPPDLPDTSAAIIPRLLMLELCHSFAGREDMTLDERLAAETPGVARWALEGLRRLRKQATFTEPDGTAELRNDFERQSAPIRAFIQDRCEVGTSDAHQVTVEDLYQAWKAWAEANGHKPGSKEGFGRRLRTATQGHVVKRRVLGTGTSYDGIRIRREDELF